MSPGSRAAPAAEGATYRADEGADNLQTHTGRDASVDRSGNNGLLGMGAGSVDVDQRAFSEDGLLCAPRDKGTMAISAQIAVYPLRQDRLTPSIQAVQQALLDHGLRSELGPMSTYVVGEDQTVFAALQDAFARASSTGHVVMMVTISNARPIPD